MIFELDESCDDPGLSLESLLGPGAFTVDNRLGPCICAFAKSGKVDFSSLTALETCFALIAKVPFCGSCSNPLIDELGTKLEHTSCNDLVHPYCRAIKNTMEAPRLAIFLYELNWRKRSWACLRCSGRPIASLVDNRDDTPLTGNPSRLVAY